MRLRALTLTLLLGAAPALAQDEEPNISFFYPLVTRRPVIEREVEFNATHKKERDGRETEVSFALEGPIFPRLQVELEIPWVFTDPRAGNAQQGIGDIGLETKFLAVKSVQHQLLAATGFEVKFPTGSERRGLGGEQAIEPFVTGGIGLGPFDLLAEVAYEWVLNGHDRPREEKLSSNVALGYRAFLWFTPLIEVNTATRTRGVDEEEGPRLLGRTQVYLTPGINLRPLTGATIRLGVELPVTKAKEFDYRLHAAFVQEF